MNPVRAALLTAVLGLLLAGCATSQEETATARPGTLEMRQMQSRRFDTPDEKKMLTACAELLQDLGFNIEDSCSELGLIVASKDRTAVDPNQVWSSLFIALLTGANTPYDKSQRFRASIVTRPTEDGKAIIVRVTFQRTVWNEQNQVSRTEELNNPAQYQKFFQMLSKAVFLQANDL